MDAGRGKEAIDWGFTVYLDYIVDIDRKGELLEQNVQINQSRIAKRI